MLSTSGKSQAGAFVSAECVGGALVRFAHCANLTSRSVSLYSNGSADGMVHTESPSVK